MEIIKENLLRAINDIRKLSKEHDRKYSLLLPRNSPYIFFYKKGKFPRDVYQLRNFFKRRYIGSLNPSKTRLRGDKYSNLT